MCHQRHEYLRMAARFKNGGLLISVSRGNELLRRIVVSRSYWNPIVRPDINGKGSHWPAHRPAAIWPEL